MAFRWKEVTPLLFCLLLIVLLTACGNTPAETTKRKVSVSYAGSLINLMEKRIGPAFHGATGYPFEGRAKGSNALVNEIKDKLATPDIFISASASLNRNLMGEANGNIVSWYVPFARSSLVLGYSPTSKFATAFEEAARGSRNWYDILSDTRLRIGRTDPLLDPKGARTVILMKLAESHYQRPGLAHTILGDDNNSRQIFPEEELVARLGSGQLDVGFFYRVEATEAHIPFIALPTQIDMSDPALESTYAQASYTDPRTGSITRGSAILYTVTILNTGKHREGALALLRFLFSDRGKELLTGEGLFLATPIISGDRDAVPPELRTLFGQ